MRRRTLIQTIGSTALVAVAGCGTSESDVAEGNGDNDNNNDTPEPEDTPEDDDTSTPEDDSPPVEILEHSLEEDDLGNARVVGKMENTTDDELSYMQVQARFFNADDERIGEAMDNASDVGSGTVVNFEIMSTVEADNVDRYELEASDSPF